MRLLDLSFLASNIFFISESSSELDAPESIRMLELFDALLPREALVCERTSVLKKTDLTLDFFFLRLLVDWGLFVPICCALLFLTIGAIYYLRPKPCFLYFPCL